MRKVLKPWNHVEEHGGCMFKIENFSVKILVISRDATILS